MFLTRRRVCSEQVSRSFQLVWITAKQAVPHRNCTCWPDSAHFSRKGDWRLEIRLGIWRKVQWGCSAQISTFGTIESRTFSSWVFYDSQRAHPFSYVALPVRNKLSLLRAVTTINSSTFPLAGARSMFKFSELVGELPSSAKRKKIRHSKLRHAFSTNW